MPLNAAGLQLGGSGIAAGIVAVALHSALPDASGSNQCASARLAASLTSTNGVVSMTSKAFTGVAANGAVTYLGFWSQVAAGGTFLGYQALTGDQAANAAGQYTVSACTITPTAS